MNGAGNRAGMRWRRLWLPAALAGLALMTGAWIDAFSNAPTGADAATRWNLSYDVGLRADFARPHRRAETPYDDVFVYFVTAFHDRAIDGGSRAREPGAPSVNGADSDGFESFARTAPLVAAWLASGRPAVVRDLHGRSLDLRKLLHDGIVAGTTPGGPSYWGPIHDLDQKIVEAADVARTIWMVRDLGVFTPDEIRRAAEWLRGALHRKVPDNNWHLYPVLIGKVLESLGEPADQAAIDAHFKRFLAFYRGGGWYSDGPGADFDFYNAWGIHYELFWLRRISPGFGGEPVREAMREFVSSYIDLVGPKGIPIMGRSICYRMAAPAPLIAAAMPEDGAPPAVDPGLARRALDAVWRYFIAKGAVADGVPTQGYCGTDLRILDNYSGPGSCLWSLRSLVLAFLSPPEAPLWTSNEEPLPIERGSYRIDIPQTRWTVTGDATTGEIRIRRWDAAAGAPPVEDYGPLRRAAASLAWPLLHRPFRPHNDAAKYHAASYSSAHPFCGCAGASEMPPLEAVRK